MAIVLLDDILASVIDSTGFGFIDDAVGDGLNEERFNSSLGTDEEGRLSRTNEFVDEDCCLETIGRRVSSSKLFLECEGDCCF